MRTLLAAFGVMWAGSASAQEVLDCDRPAPPTGGFDYEIGFADGSVGNADQRAFEAAREQLRRRLCGERLDCTEVMAEVKRWTSGGARGQRCVMATVLKSHVRGWLARSASAEPLDLALAERARHLFDEVQSRRGGPAKVRPPTAVLGQVLDGGVVGGARAMWVAGRVEQALKSAGFRLVEVVERRARGAFDVSVGVHLHERGEGRVEILEVGLRGLWGEEVLRLEPAWCGLDAVRTLAGGSQRGLGKRRELFGDPGLRLEVETGQGGKLCEGDKTQIHLTTDKSVHVRVIDLYSREGGLVIFPNEWVTDDKVAGGQTVPLGGKSAFDVMMVPGSEEERYIVLAAERREDLGPWAKLSGTCRLAPEVVERLLDMDRVALPARVRAAETGFRVVRDGCGAPPSEEKKARLLADLMAVRACPKVW